MGKATCFWAISTTYSPCSDLDRRLPGSCSRRMRVVYTEVCRSMSPANALRACMRSRQREMGWLGKAGCVDGRGRLRLESASRLWWGESPRGSTGKTRDEGGKGRGLRAVFVGGERLTGSRVQRCTSAVPSSDGEAADTNRERRGQPTPARSAPLAVSSRPAIEHLAPTALQAVNR